MPACPACSADLPDGARFCFACGATQAAPACKACGNQLVAGARFCMECGAAQASTPPPQPPQPVASRRVTSVLFGDLVGFTSLSETRDHEEVRELLSSYFDGCRRVVERYGGTVEKFIGDAVMAVWGVPSSHEDDAERAVRAGLELVAAVNSLGEEEGIAGLAMRVGIVTGEVAVTIGAEQQGMVAGDAVNTAARVQAAAAPGQVWVDETTRLLTTSAISYADAGSHAMKGKADPVPLWSVRAVVAGIGGDQRADGLEAPLIGRDRDLRMVKELFHSVEETHRPALLVLAGEPGVGKTRLAWEFEKYVDGLLTSTALWHSGRCVAYGEGVAFYALAEAVRARLRGPGEDEVTGDDAQHLDAGLATYVPDEAERAWLRPRLGALLGIGSVGTFPREDLFSAWATFLRRVGEDEHPVVLVIDDAQHADDGLLQFVEYVLDVGEFGCYVVLLTRPGLLEAHPGLATNRRATVRHLDVLEGDDVANLLDGLVAGLPDDVRTALVERAEGVPLFAVETVRSLIDRDLVVPRGGQYVLAQPDTLDLGSIGAPASLHALVAARLDALGPQQRRLVDRASVIGTVFSREQIAALCGELDAMADPDHLLASLVRLQILSQLASRFSADFGQYQFVQSVVRQVAYASLSRRDRRTTHLAVAGIIEVEAADGASSDDLAPIVAQHYLDAIEAVPGEADVPDLEHQVIVHLERAAGRARVLGALTESAGHLVVALERAREPRERARLQCALAWALADSGDYAAAIPHAEEATRVFDELGEPIAAGSAAAAQALALLNSGDMAAALSIATPRWEALVDDADADRTLLELSGVMVIPETSSEHHLVADKRVVISERLGDSAELAGALSTLSVHYSYVGAPATARILLEASADLARTHHLPIALARCLVNLCAEYNLNELERGIAYGREAVAAATRTGHARWSAYAHLNLTIGLTAAGEWAEVQDRVAAWPRSSPMERAVSAGLLGMVGVAQGQAWSLPWSEQDPLGSDDPFDLSWAGAADGLAAWSRGDLGAAQEHLMQAATTMLGAGGVYDDYAHIWPLAAEIAMVRGDDDALGELLGRVEASRVGGVVPPALEAHRTRVAGLRARQQEPGQAEPLLRESIDRYAVWGSVPYRARTEAELGAWLMAQGRAEEGQELLERGRATLTELGAQAWLAETEPAGLPTT